MTQALAAALALAVGVGCSAGEDGDDSGSGDEIAPPTACVGGQPRAKPAALPTYASLNLYAADSPWRTALAADAALDPQSALYVQGLKQAVDDSGGFLVQVREYSAPVFFADADTPRCDVALACGEAWELGVAALAGVPIPTHAEPGDDASAADSPVPTLGCGEASMQDNNMVIVDLAQRCEWDLWQARKVGGGWVASWASSASLDGPGVLPHGTSSRGSGFAFLGGMVWPDELTSGAISHALAFAYPFPRAGGPVAPATDSDGESTEAFALPEGARVRLDPTLDLDALGLSAVERAFAVAMQTYGMILVDSAGEHGLALYAVDPKSAAADPYGATLGAATYAVLAKIPADKLQVLELGPQDGAWRGKLKPLPACGSYRAAP
jgi:hypothetical protein